MEAIAEGGASFPRPITSTGVRSPSSTSRERESISRKPSSNRLTILDDCRNCGGNCRCRESSSSRGSHDCRSSKIERGLGDRSFSFRRRPTMARAPHLQSAASPVPGTLHLVCASRLSRLHDQYVVFYWWRLGSAPAAGALSRNSGACGLYSDYDGLGDGMR